jgi:hypothetical protein
VSGSGETIGDVIDIMQKLDQSLPANDGVACFNRMYLEVTKGVQSGLKDGFFDNPEFMARLDVIFANFYLEAVRSAAPGGSGHIPTAWRPLIATRSHPDIYSIQFAWAGMSAHIYHDLPLAVVRTCRQGGTAPDAGTIHADFQKVDTLLAGVAQSVRQSFESGLALEVDERMEAALDRMSDWSINSARDVAWGNAVLLWTLRDHACVERALRWGLAEAVAVLCRWLLRPV